MPSGKSGIEPIAQPVPEKVQAQHAAHDRQARKHADPPRRLQIITPVSQHAAPARRKRIDAKPEKSEAAFEQDIVRDIQRHQHDDRAAQVRQHMAQDDRRIAHPDRMGGLNEFAIAQRHHLRIFRRPDTFAGKPVWVCSSTHDTGIDFSERDRTFIHKVDGRIDRERAKVVADLLFTGLVKSVALVERPDVPATIENATGDALQTDGRMAVLLF